MPEPTCAAAEISRLDALTTTQALTPVCPSCGGRCGFFLCPCCFLHCEMPWKCGECREQGHATQPRTPPEQER